VRSRHLAKPAKDDAMLKLKAQAGINTVVWISSPADDDERWLTEKALILLEPLLQITKIRLLKFEPKSAADLSHYFVNLEQETNKGMRPIVHLDTHGSELDGLYVAATDEFVSWRELVNQLRPINVAAQNNLCVVSAACCSMHTLMNMDFDAPTPFFLMLAPQHEVTFGFVGKRMHNFYEAAFTSHDFMGAHDAYLAPEFQQYHSHRLSLKAISGYMRDSCIGKGGRKRIRGLVKQNLGPGKQHPDTPENRKLARNIARQTIRPTQELIDRHAKPFLMGQALPISFDDVLSFARADAMRRNVLVRRAARSKRRNRRVQNAKRVCLHANA
jgi:hypothetical protein